MTKGSESSQPDRLRRQFLRAALVTGGLATASILLGEQSSVKQVMALSSTSTTILDQPSTLRQGASYVILNNLEPPNVQAVNMSSGSVDFSDPDASLVIQQAIDALPNGGRIFANAGEYSLTRSIKLADNLEIAGEGDATIFHCPPNSQAFISTDPESNQINVDQTTGNWLKGTGGNTGVYLHDFTIVGNETPRQIGIVLVYSNQCTVERVSMTDLGVNSYPSYSDYMDFDGCGVDIDKSQDCIVRDVQIMRPGTTGVMIQDTSYGNGQHNTRNTVTSSDIDGGTSCVFGVHIINASDCTISYNTIRHCEGIQDQGGGGVYLECMSNEFSTDHNSIVGNVLNDNALTAQAWYNGGLMISSYCQENAAVRNSFSNNGNKSAGHGCNLGVNGDHNIVAFNVSLDVNNSDIFVQSNGTDNVFMRNQNKAFFQDPAATGNLIL